MIQHMHISCTLAVQKMPGIHAVVWSQGGEGSGRRGGKAEGCRVGACESFDTFTWCPNSPAERGGASLLARE